MTPTIPDRLAPTSAEVRAKTATRMAPMASIHALTGAQPPHGHDQMRMAAQGEQHLADRRDHGGSTGAHVRENRRKLRAALTTPTSSTRYRQRSRSAF